LVNKDTKAHYHQPTKYYYDSDCCEIAYLNNYHTPTGLIDHNYIWQSKQQEVVEINSKSPPITEETAHIISNYKATMHNVQPPVAAIYKPQFGTLLHGNTNYFIFKKILPTSDKEYFTY
jgi:hypothetical protein